MGLLLCREWALPADLSSYCCSHREGDSRRSMALSPGWNSSMLRPMGQQPLSQERKALTGLIPVQS